MALTRSEILNLVTLNTGHSDKTDLMETLCNIALKTAVLKHPFRDSLITMTYSITEDDMSTDISDTEWLNIISTRIIDTSSEEYDDLILKPKTWWDKKIVYPEANSQGWPKYGCYYNKSINYDRPVRENLSLKVRGSQVLTFDTDETECPISSLDMFVESYVTSRVFLSIQEMDSYRFWNSQAFRQLEDAIDSEGNIAETLKFEQPDKTINDSGITTINDEGEIKRWY